MNWRKTGVERGHVIEAMSKHGEILGSVWYWFSDSSYTALLANSTHNQELSKGHKTIKIAQQAVERGLIALYFRYEWDSQDSCYHVWQVANAFDKRLYRYEATPLNKAKVLAQAKKDFLAEL